MFLLYKLQIFKALSNKLFIDTIIKCYDNDNDSGNGNNNDEDDDNNNNSNIIIIITIIIIIIVKAKVNLRRRVSRLSSCTHQQVPLLVFGFPLCCVSNTL